MRLKLVSYSHDTLLGHIDVPDHWREWLEKGHDAVSTAIMPKLRYSPEAAADYAIAMPNIKKITIVKAYHSEYRDAVYLYEGSIEELERLPGCSFTPSMAYLRSHMQ